MQLRSHTSPVVFQKGSAVFSFLPSGDIQSFTQGGFLLNGFVGTQKEGSANNIYLRVYHEGGVRAYPLLGIRSGSAVSVGPDRLASSGEREGVAYRVTFFAGGEGVWLWNVELFAHDRTVDLLYGQDIGVGAIEGVLDNELYIAQYLGHTILQTDHGYVVASRQNQPQSGRFPYLQQGMLRGRAVRYSTDATQFFGLSYKSDHHPAALAGDLENRNYQFELSYIALQSEKLVLSGSYALTFYGIFREDHPAAIRGLEFQELAEAALARLEAVPAAETPLPPVLLRPGFGEPYASPDFSEEEIKALYPCRKLEERGEGGLLSFFTEDHAHVATRRKELLVERPHGTILTSRINSERVEEELLSSTNYIYGLFNAQTAVGNTSYHKLLSASRGLLNLLKNHGQRLYIRLNGQYRLLTLPALYEMGMNYARWIYGIGDDRLTITVYTLSAEPAVVLEAESQNGAAYDLVLATQLVLGETELASPVEAERPDAETLRLWAAAWKRGPYPRLCYDFRVEGEADWSDDRIFFADGNPRNGTLLTVSAKGRSRFRAVMAGWLYGTGALPPCDFAAEKAACLAAFEGLNRGFRLEAPAALARQAEKLNETAWWYTHNAMIHFAAPHGLEQPGGAAWGVRDVCQGPFEYFLCTQRYSLAREILLRLFAHQSSATGEWFQWFMFDRHTAHAGDCHGDVVFWPLKCLGDYLKATEDTALLCESVGWLDGYGQAKLTGHLRRCLENIRGRFLPGTDLLNYAGGDWDDTLQPADSALKERMASAWTQALACQALRQLGGALERAEPALAEEFTGLSARLGEAFNRRLIRDGTIAGFARLDSDGGLRCLLHPSDETTGIHYRLLPMTRSIIAGLVSPAQARRNRTLIEEHLACPDGVRLMDRPARYDGGVSRLFLRAEQAANVGREISLQYIHAHIRYIEAMAKLGAAEDVWRALFVVNPILLGEVVPNAAPRQSNLYFSSSDGAFSDRYEYDRDFFRLFDGSIGVKGGWRLYSSGPGIYMNQLISNVLGLRFFRDCLEVDPVLPAEVDGLILQFECFGKRRRFVYRKGGKGRVMLIRGGKRLKTSPGAKNPYRPGGVRLSRALLLEEEGDIEVFF